MLGRCTQIRALRVGLSVRDAGFLALWLELRLSLLTEMNLWCDM
jgi:hypothetical protein